jgi:hypothetical protein
VWKSTGEGRTRGGYRAGSRRYPDSLTSPAEVKGLAFGRRGWSLLELAAEATSESVRLTAAFRVLELVPRRRAGFDLFSEQEVITFTRQLVEVALPRIPAEQQEGFLLEVRALGSR